MDGDRLKALLQVVAGKSKPKDLEPERLNALLFYADTRAYRELGSSVTHGTYTRGTKGPELADLSGAIAEVEATRPASDRARKFEPARIFSEAELEVVEAVLRELGHLSTKEFGIKVRKEWGWLLTNEGEEIPLASSWVSSDPLTPEQIATGRRLWDERAL